MTKIAVPRSLLTSCLLVAALACVAPPSEGEGAEAEAETEPATDAAPKAKAVSTTPGFTGTPVSTTTLPGGLLIEDFKIGEGEQARRGAQVSVHYTGTLADGTMFDTSRKRGRPFMFTIGRGRVIKGWELGVPGMKVGGKRRLTVPAELGYGPRAKGKIPPNSALIFTMELVAAEPQFQAAKGAEAFAGEPVQKRALERGLLIEDFATGDGRIAKAGDKVYVHYTGKLDDGTVFDSSVPRDKPIGFVLGTGRVIPGWDLGIAGMKVGGLRKLIIPAELAYGARAKGKIPANSRLTFRVELMGVQDGAGWKR